MFSEGGKNRLNNELMERNVYTYFIVAIDTFNISLPYQQLYHSLHHLMAIQFSWQVC